MTLNVAHWAFVGMTMAFLGVALTLYILGIALLAASACLIVAFFGFLVFASMLTSDTRARERGQEN